MSLTFVGAPMTRKRPGNGNNENNGNNEINGITFGGVGAKRYVGAHV